MPLILPALADLPKDDKVESILFPDPKRRLQVVFAPGLQNSTARGSEMQPEHAWMNIPMPMNLTGDSIKSYKEKMHIAYFARTLFRYVETERATYGPHTLNHAAMLDIVKEIQKQHSDFHKTNAKAINPSVNKLSQVQICSMTEYDEVTKEGSAKVLLDVFLTSGLIIKNRKGGLQLATDAQERFLQLWGDGLSIVLVESVMRTLFERLPLQNKNSLEIMMLSILDDAFKGPGDFHFLMHMLELVFRFSYGGFLQPIQYLLRRKRIQLNPNSRFQASRQLALEVAQQLQILSVRLWQQSLTNGAEIFIAEDNTMVSLMELRNYTDDVQLSALNGSYEQFLNKRRHQDNDEVCKFLITYLDCMKDFQIFERSVHCGDPLSVELITVSWGPLFASVGKSKYANIVAAWFEQAYTILSPAELELLRNNRFILLTLGKGHIGKDDFQEKINQWLKEIRADGSMKSFVKVSQFLSLIRRAHLTVRDMYTNKKVTAKHARKSTKTSKHCTDQKLIFTLLDELKCLDIVPGRKFEDGYVWKEVIKMFYDLERPRHILDSNDSEHDDDSDDSEHKMRDKEIHDMFSTPLECIPNIVHDSNMEDNNEESNENDVNTNETNEKPMPKRYTLNIKCWSALCNHEWVKYKELLVRRNACRVKNAKRKLRHKAALVYYQLVLQRDAKLCKDMIGQIAMSQIATSDWPQLQPAPQSLRFSGTPQAVEAAKLTLPLQFHQYIWQHGSSMKLCGTRDCIFYAGHDDPEVGCSMHSNAEDLATATRKRKRRPPWFQQYIGRRVMKCFGTYGNFVGTVTEFDATNGFHIVYDLDKDDPEDLDKEGMRAILISHEEDQLYSQRQEYIQKMIVEVWGKPAAKQFQVQAILNIVQNSKNTLICHQTGSGKSLVALGAATILGGVTLVIIPLLSLGTDQLLLRYIRTVGTYTVMNITQLAKLITCFWN